MKMILIRVILAVVLLVLVGITILSIQRYFGQQEKIKISKALVQNGGISEVRKVKLGGVNQYILIEGSKKTNPILLMLHGGPGSPFPFGVSSRSTFPELTKDFTVVYWDQRGAGKSYNKNIHKDSINLDQLVSDGNELVDYLRDEFSQEQINLAGQSWGTVIGLNLVNRYPEKFNKYVANAQIVSIPESQKVGYDWLKTKAEKDQKLKNELEKLGNHPYKEREREKIFGDLLKKNGAYTYKNENGEGVSELSLIKGAWTSPDYTLKDLYAGLVSGFLFSWNDSFFKEFVNYDFSEINNIQVPMTIIQGKEDYIAPRKVTEVFVEGQKFREKHKYILLEDTAHFADLEEMVKLINDALK
ncbi:MAG TPA: alpha/beta hydrolase [Pseudoneobacillus sp.]|nr:alpha/beta hydrolase [Pseudoneobacillus sp.]